jgi:hypothetical protein
MKIIKSQDKVKGAIESFLANYPQYNTPNAPFYTKERYNRVIALDPDKATPEDIKRDINSSWVMSFCSECGGEFDTVIQVGQEPDYDSCTAYLCKDCLYKAFDMVAKAECEKC